jgi:arylsulfatase
MPLNRTSLYRDRLRPALVAALLRVLALGLARVSWPAAQRCGRGVGALIWWCGRRDRRRALHHLELAFPDLPAGTPMDRRPSRHLPAVVCAAACLLSSLALAACHKKQPLGKPWVRLDLTQEKPFVEAAPPGINEGQAYQQRVATLGPAEVRDLARVPKDQLLLFPKGSAAEIRVLEQASFSRLEWRAHVDEGSYVSFIPLGYEKSCVPCKFRFGVRTAKYVEVLYELDAKPLSSPAPQAVELDLSKFAGEDLDLLFQVDGPPPPPPGELPPSLLWGSPALYGRQPQPSAYKPDRPNIVLVGFDTLRADRLGPWGRRPSLTPEIDRLAEESDVWTEAFSTFNSTNPSFVSIMTGLYGKNHGVYDLHTRLPASFSTLARRLADAGYQTMAIISARHLGDHNSGLGQGFAELTRSNEHFAAELGVDQTLDWIAGHCTRPRPFFVWLHLFDPHTPHSPPQPYADGLRPAGPTGLGPVRAWVPFRTPGPRQFDEQVLGGNRDLYDGEVAYMDRQVGRLLDGIASRGLLDTTLVALVADHGENLGDHGLLYRHVGLFDTTTHVPLLVRWPGPPRAGHRYDGLVQTIDLFPTLLAAAGLRVPPQDGIDLRQVSGAGAAPSADAASAGTAGAAGTAGTAADTAGAAAAAPLLAAAAGPPGGSRGRRAVFAEHSNGFGAMVRTRDYKYVVSRGNTYLFPDGPALYDLRADPQETRNLAGRGVAAEHELAALLEGWLAQRRPRPGAAAGPARQEPLSAEEAARLRSLGYVREMDPR